MADPEMREFMSRGDIIQIDPDFETNVGFAGCLAIVDEVKSWGVQAFVQTIGTREERGGQAFIRLKWDEFDLTGAGVPWLLVDGDAQ